MLPLIPIRNRHIVVRSTTNSYSILGPLPTPPLVLISIIRHPMPVSPALFQQWVHRRVDFLLPLSHARYTIRLASMLSFIGSVVSTACSVTTALMESMDGSDATVFSTSIWMPAFVRMILKRSGYTADSPVYPYCVLFFSFEQ